MGEEGHSGEHDTISLLYMSSGETEDRGCGQFTSESFNIYEHCLLALKKCVKEKALLSKPKHCEHSQ